MLLQHREETLSTNLPHTYARIPLFRAYDILNNNPASLRWGCVFVVACSPKCPKMIQKISFLLHMSKKSSTFAASKVKGKYYASSN